MLLNKEADRTLSHSIPQTSQPHPWRTPSSSVFPYHQTVFSLYIRPHTFQHMYRPNIKLTAAKFIWTVLTLWTSITSHPSLYTVTIVTLILVFSTVWCCTYNKQSYMFKSVQTYKHLTEMLIERLNLDFIK